MGCNPTRSLSLHRGQQFIQRNRGEAGGGIAHGIRRQVLLRNFKAHLRRVIVTARKIIDRQDEPLQGRIFRRQRAKQVGRERGDAAFPRQLIAEEGNFADVRWLLHEIFPGCTGELACAFRRPLFVLLIAPLPTECLPEIGNHTRAS